MLRGFTDSTGVEWRVWDVFPTKCGELFFDTAWSTSFNETAFANGWLCFESPAEKRRLAPIPAGWELGDILSLEEMCRRAHPVPVRKRLA